MKIPHIDWPGLRAPVYIFALTELTTEGDETVSDINDFYREGRDILIETQKDVMGKDEIRVIQQHKNLTHYVLHM